MTQTQYSSRRKFFHLFFLNLIAVLSFFAGDPHKKFFNIRIINNTTQSAKIITASIKA